MDSLNCLCSILTHRRRPWRSSVYIYVFNNIYSSTTFCYAFPAYERKGRNLRRLYFAAEFRMTSWGPHWYRAQRYAIRECKVDCYAAHWCEAGDISSSAVSSGDIFAFRCLNFLPWAAASYALLSTQPGLKSAVAHKLTTVQKSV